jgi:hypothetical protein
MATTNRYRLCSFPGSNPLNALAALRLIALLTLVLLSACAGFGSADRQLPVAQNLIATANANYGAAYSSALEDVLFALAGDSGRQANTPTSASQSDLPIALDVLLLARQFSRDGMQDLLVVENAAVLTAGDELKVWFTVNCDCYTYAIGIDSTGYLSVTFPTPDSGFDSPAEAGKQYALPAGPDWRALKKGRGIEHVYFLVASGRRLDIEQALQAVAGQKPKDKPAAKAVTEPAPVPEQPGLINAQAAPPVEIVSDGSYYELSPTTYVNTVASADLRVTRWFEHK